MATKKHKVINGEWAEKIAVSNGLTHDTVWNHSANEKLRGKRTNPNLLCEGDQLNVPPPSEKKSESCASGSSHRFKTNLPSTAKLVLKIESFLEDAFEAKYELDIGGKAFNGTSSGGDIALDIPIQSDHGVLRFPDKNIVITLNVGYLTGIEPWNNKPCEIQGLQARLNNLSFPSGPVDGITGRQTKAGTGRFQRWAETYSPGNGLSAGELSPVDRIPGPLTAGCLKKIYGM